MLTRRLQIVQHQCRAAVSPEDIHLSRSHLSRHHKHIIQTHNLVLINAKVTISAAHQMHQRHLRPRIPNQQFHFFNPIKHLFIQPTHRTHRHKPSLQLTKADWNDDTQLFAPKHGTTSKIEYSEYPLVFYHWTVCQSILWCETFVNVK